MSTPRWSRRWLYDSTVEVPKTTRWRRKIDSSNPAREDEVVDIRGEFFIRGVRRRIRSRLGKQHFTI